MYEHLTSYSIYYLLVCVMLALDSWNYTSCDSSIFIIIGFLSLRFNTAAEILMIYEYIIFFIEVIPLIYGLILCLSVLNTEFKNGALYALHWCFIIIPILVFLLYIIVHSTIAIQSFAHI